MYLLLIVCILLYFPSVFLSKTSSNYTKSNSLIFKYCLYTSILGIAIGAILILLGDRNFSLDMPALWSSLLFGCMIAFCGIVTVYGLKITTVAIINMCNTISVAIPCIFGIIVFQEQLTIGTGIGIVLFFISAYLLISPNTQAVQSKPFTFKTLLVCLALVFSNGFGSVSMQLFSNYSTGVSESAFMFYSYVFTAIINAILVGVLMLKERKTAISTVTTQEFNPETICESAFSAEKTQENKIGKFPKILFLLGLGSTVISFFLNQVNTIITPHIPAAILFPSLKGGALVMSALVGWTIFKEKLSSKNIIGIVLCLSALIVLKLF